LVLARRGVVFAGHFRKMAIAEPELGFRAASIPIIKETLKKPLGRLQPEWDEDCVGSMSKSQPAQRRSVNIVA
jgi:hypothetical protein